MVINLLVFLAFLMKGVLFLINNCPVYSCENLDKHICSIKEDRKYQLKECPHLYTCDFRKDERSLCNLSRYEYNERAYLRGKCEKDIDCLSRICSFNTCIGGSVDKKCESNDNCEFGFHCKSNQCVAPANEGDECKKDEDCVWPLGCFKEKCTKYFSIKNMFAGDDTQPLFCESGKSYNNICNTIYRQTKTSCDDKTPCVYQDLNEMYITLSNACVCTISDEPEEVCKEGDAKNPYWITALSLMKKSISVSYANTCNAQEKRPGFCRESLRNDWEVRNMNIELQKSLIFAENVNRITSRVPCSLKSILQFDDTPPKPKNGLFECPAYHCNNDSFVFDDKTCAYSHNPFNSKGKDVSVQLHNVCAKGYRCDYRADNIYLNWTTNATCAEITSQKSWRYKYPGEDCTSHSQCLPGTKKEVRYCIDGICSGENNDCLGHRDCSKGYFCNGFKCQKQKKDGYQCLEQFECLNYLGCLNNTCVGYYSLPNGTYLNKTNPDPTLCKMGQINEETNQCAETDYYNIVEGQKDENGFVKCTIGQLCNYTTGYYIKKKPVVSTTVCECGFRENGYSYCPIPQTVNQYDWKNLFKLKNNQFDNNCHTLRRNECIEEFSDSNRNALSYYLRKTINAHLFYESSNCIIEILSSFTLTVNLLFLLLIISFNY